MTAQTPETGRSEPSKVQDYEKSLEDWRFENEKRLAAPTGWLALIAHVWLERGDQSMGTADDDAIRLPKDLGEQVRGTIQVEGNQVRLQCEESSGIQVNGMWLATTDLHIDSHKLESDSPDKVTIGDRIGIQLVRRNGRLAVRVRDGRSESITRFAGKRWFPVDRSYCVDARYQAHAHPKPIRIVNIRGEETTAEIVGVAEFELSGQRLQLDAMLDSPTELFFVFKDGTSGQTTYGPGRFLNTEVPQDGESFELDFNKSYNPPCAFSPFTLCPLPPKQNHLPISIPAGEMLPRQH